MKRRAVLIDDVWLPRWGLPFQRCVLLSGRPPHYDPLARLDSLERRARAWLRGPR